jgi:hypothetical protein
MVATRRPRAGTVLPEVGSDHWPSRAHMIHEDLVWAVASVRWRLFTTASMDGRRGSGRRTLVVPSPASLTRNVVAVAFSPDGRYPATTSSDYIPRGMGDK